MFKGLNVDGKSVKLAVGFAAVSVIAVGIIGSLYESRRGKQRKVASSQKYRTKKYINQHFDDRKPEILGFISLQSWNNFDQIQLETIYENFMQYTHSPKSGNIERKQFYDMCHEDGMVDEEVLDKLYVFWAGHNASINFLDLVKALNLLCTGGKEEQLAKYFEVYDLDGNGVLSINELEHMMSAFHPTRSKETVKKAVHELMDWADEDHNLSLSFNEFVHLARNPDFHFRADQGFNLHFIQRFGLDKGDIIEHA